MFVFLSVSTGMLAKINLGPQDCAIVLPAIAMALSKTGLERLEYENDGTTRSPVEVMTGISSKQRILRVLSPSLGHMDAKSNIQARAIQIIKTDKLQASLDNMNKEVHISVTKGR